MRTKDELTVLLRLYGLAKAGTRFGQHRFHMRKKYLFFGPKTAYVTHVGGRISERLYDLSSQEVLDMAEAVILYRRREAERQRQLSELARAGLP